MVYTLKDFNISVKNLIEFLKSDVKLKVSNLSMFQNEFKKLEEIAQDNKSAPNKGDVLSFLKNIHENAVFYGVIFAELMTLAFELCVREKRQFYSYIEHNRVWICLLMGCSKSVLKTGESVDFKISFAKLVGFMQGILGGECLQSAQVNEANKFVISGLGTLVAIGQKKHTKGVISELSKRAVRNVISVIRGDIILFHTVPSMGMEVDGLSLSYAETYIFSNIKDIVCEMNAERKRLYVLTGRGLLPRIYGRMDTVLSERMGAL